MLPRLIQPCDKASKTSILFFLALSSKFWDLILTRIFFSSLLLHLFVFLNIMHVNGEVYVGQLVDICYFLIHHDVLEIARVIHAVAEVQVVGTELVEEEGAGVPEGHVFFWEKMDVFG